MKCEFSDSFLQIFSIRSRKFSFTPSLLWKFLLADTEFYKLPFLHPWWWFHYFSAIFLTQWTKLIIPLLFWKMLWKYNRHTEKCQNVKYITQWMLTNKPRGINSQIKKPGSLNHPKTPSNTAWVPRLPDVSPGLGKDIWILHSK
jgi:hypothetical protein